jgi:hypothetical protein
MLLPASRSLVESSRAVPVTIFEEHGRPSADLEKPSLEHLRYHLKGSREGPQRSALGLRFSSRSARPNRAMPSDERENLPDPCAGEMIGVIYFLSCTATSSSVAARQKRIV